MTTIIRSGIFLLSLLPAALIAQPLSKKTGFTKADTLRGTLNANRNWWNVLRYDVEVTPDFGSETIAGRTSIRYAGNGHKTMQIDLQQPLVIDSIMHEGEKVRFTREDNIALLYFTADQSNNEENSVVIYYHGKPRRAVRPPGMAAGYGPAMPKAVPG